ncbi:phosphoribosyl-AMP cyclohydrolase [Candidatus Sumerlaeota bacterium]|nr:phosphoribosyl-AMP cyclohydrolase [Candidatus Sumerlaeota bacterium]
MTESNIVFADRNDRRAVEEGVKFAPKFDENGLIPAVTTDYQTGELLMQAFMNAEALKRTIELGEAVYWSRSRQEIWHKGATSGMVQKVREIRTDCDQDCIWLRVEMIGGACCHTGYRSCFYRSVPVGGDPAGEIDMQFEESQKVFDPNKVYGK